jgi:HlyD family secretion protein
MIALVLMATAAGGGWYWWQTQQTKVPEGLASGNGRIESDQVDIAAKTAGRVREVLVQEGDLVTAGQIVARIDSAELQAERAKYAADVLNEQVTMLEGQATVTQRQAELVLKEANLRRALTLVGGGSISEQSRNEAQSERDSARSILASKLSTGQAIPPSVL